MIRLAKYISNCGFCSRRNAELLIAQKRVAVDGKIVTTAVTLVGGTEIISVDGETLKPLTKPRLWLYYKPIGLITSHSDPQGRPTVFNNLPTALANLHLISVGRLDLNSEGLLLLTDSPKLARFCEHPANTFTRIYKVRVHGNADWSKLKSILSKGITIDSIRYKPVTLNYLSHSATNSWLEIQLLEGKNREIRKILEYFGLQVSRLIRIQFGHFALGELAKGQAVEVSSKLLEAKLDTFFMS